MVDGKVALSRQSYGSSDKATREAEVFWSQPHSFFVPAFTSTLENLLSSSAGMLLNPPALPSGTPALPSGTPARFVPVTLQFEDVRPAVEFIIVAVEAGRKDRLKNLDFSLELGSPLLWILP